MFRQRFGRFAEDPCERDNRQCGGDENGGRRRAGSVEGGAGVWLWGERVLLREALVNLLQNALEFTPAGGTVSLRAEVAFDQVRLSVADTGCGVPDYALNHVFDRFYSLPRPGTGRKSTGLGLSLVREIAHLHGGAVKLGNRPEGGALAILWVPPVG